MGFFKEKWNILFNKTVGAYKKGMHFYNKLEFAKAIEYFEQQLENKADSLESKLTSFYCGLSYRNLGIIQFAKNNNEDALFNFRNALKYNSEHVDLNYFIGICLNNIGDFQNALASFKIIQEIEPWNIPNKIKMAIMFQNMEMWNDAEELYRKLLEENSNFADIHFYLGLSFMGQGRTYDAAESFKNALDINPEYIAARIKLGVTQICLGQYDKAFAHLNIIIKQNPEYADVYYIMSIIKEERNETHEAVKYLQKALDISPKYKNALVKLIICYCQLGQIDSAQKQIKEALSYYPDDKRLNAVEKWFNIFDPESKQNGDIPREIRDIFEEGYSIRDLRNEFHRGLDIMPNFSEMIAMFSSSKYGQEDSSIADLLIPIISEEISKNPTYPDLHNSLGSQLLFRNQNLEAEKAFTKAVDLNPEYITARINLFKILQKNNKHEEAYEHGRILLSKGLPFPDIYYTMTQVLIDLKQYDEALINARRVLKLRPSMINTHLLIAQIYENQGNYDSAEKEVEKCLANGTESRLAADAEKLLNRLQKK